MKKRYGSCAAIIMLLLLSVLSSFALSAELEDIGMRARELEITLDMNSWLKVAKTSSNSAIMDLEWRIYYNPLDTWQQKVLSKSISPTSAEAPELVFEWPSPKVGIYNFSLQANLLVTNDLIKITRKLDFPLNTTSQEAMQYLLPSGNADSDNPLIKEKATELVSGQDDLNKAVFKLFSWVTDNIEYRRNDFTQGTAQSASWTLESRYGVCDEITSLFIAMARSVGIPARYVSGISYTNVDGKDNWEPHAWAELYFPSYGWVPFDPTYREYGYVDPTHIVLMYGTDSNQSTGTAEWVGRNVQITQSQLDITASLKQRFGSVDDLVEIDIEPLRKDIAFGSYSLLKADVKNPHDYYVYTDLTLVKATYFTTDDPLQRAVLLGPGEEKSVYWLVKAREDFKPGFYYTLPMIVVTSRNTSMTAELVARETNTYYSKADMERLLPKASEESEFNYLKRIDIECNPEKEEIYPYEGQEIFCSARNTGNIALTQISICIEQDCRQVQLGIAESAEVNFTLPPAQPAIYERSVKVKGQGIYKTTSARYSVLDEPRLEISELEYPVDIKYKGVYKISCRIKHVSDSPAYNVSLRFTNRQSESFDFPILDADQPVFLYFEGKDMRYGKNNVVIELGYHNKNGKRYDSTQDIEIRFGEATFIERLNLSLIEMKLWLWNLF